MMLRVSESVFRFMKLIPVSDAGILLNNLEDFSEQDERAMSRQTKKRICISLVRIRLVFSGLIRNSNTLGEFKFCHFIHQS